MIDHVRELPPGSFGFLAPLLLGGLVDVAIRVCPAQSDRYVDVA
jgi:hypothetical protein